MSWRVEWNALANRITGLLEAGRFYLETKRIRSDDPHQVAKKQLLPQAKLIFEQLKSLNSTQGSLLPSGAAQCLSDFVGQYEAAFNKVDRDEHGAVQFQVTTLVSFRAEFEFHLSDFSAFARKLSERAFLHIQRCIVVDREERAKWITAFEEGEPACEKLGATRLLQHGIWAFKFHAIGERTDLVFGEPLRDLSKIEKSADALVLTEWKKASSDSEVRKSFADAKDQVCRYARGALAGLELAQYRYLVMVSKKVSVMLDDIRENEIIYRYVNIAVDPAPPSR